MKLIKDNYFIGELDVLEICKEYDTPLYVYDGEKIKSQYRALTEAFKESRIKIKYACKALANINILKILKNEGSGIDAVSIQEVQLALKVGFKSEDILYTPNCVAFEEIKRAVEMGVKINIDNISMLEQFGHEYGSSVDCCVRINPHIIAGGHSHIQTGHIDSKFGISIHQLRHVMRVVKTNSIKVTGIHMHTGSDILDGEVFLKGMEVLLEAAGDFEDLEYIDFGSGFKVAYQDDDITTDIEDLGKKVSERFNAFCKEYGKALELWFEPGKFLVSEAGYFFVKVNVIKQTTSTVFAGVDSGFNHMLRPMFYEGHHQIMNVSNPKAMQRVYTVVGYICETDTFGWDRKINEVREGDILCMKNAGAYGFAMSSNYNSRYRPAEVLIHNGTPHLIRKREDFDDLLLKQIPLDI